ncbi:hypothetical protein ABIB81_004552 [Bradyrhizobium sp. I1.7.5]
MWWGVQQLNRWQKFALDHYAGLLSAIAIVVSGGSLYVAKLSYDFSVAKELREVQEKQPVFDLQITPRGASAAAFALSILNRSESNIRPLSMRVENSIEAGELYLSSRQQCLDKLSSTLDLQPMGTIAPKGTAKLDGILAGATDGKWDSLTPGLELDFTFRFRHGDRNDTIETMDVVRSILPPVTDRLRPTPEMFLSVIQQAQQNARQKERLYFIGQIIAAVAAFSVALVFILRRLRHKRG